MWVLVAIALISGINDKNHFDAESVWMMPPVISFDTEEQCHEHIRLLHKESDGGSLTWKTGKILSLTFNKNLMYQCLPTTPKKSLTLH